MRTAVDTNVFVALFSGDEETVPVAQDALEDVSDQGLLVVCPAVYAELVAGRDSEAVESFFSRKGIEIDWDLGKEVWCTAGTRYGKYALARRRQRGDAGPRRILADFLIGAHAFHLAQAFLTFDTRIYGTYFPELKIVAPGAQA